MGEASLADRAGLSDAAVVKKTGRDWAGWVQALDDLEAHTLDHAAIVRRLTETWPEVGAWWAQMITVGYERIKGLRAEGQKCTGDFSASKSKTFRVPLTVLYAAFADEAVREGWMGLPTTVRTATEGRSMRLNWPDGTRVAFWFTEKGPEKCAVSVDHEKLTDAAHREAEKVAWGERLKALQQLLGA